VIISPLAIPLFRLALFILKWTVGKPLLFLATKIIQLLFPDNETLRENKRLRKLAKERAWQNALFIDAMETLLCDYNPRPNLADLPKKHQTIYLKFLETKVRVCRPFQR
jgi:hypothetical protein